MRDRDVGFLRLSLMFITDSDVMVKILESLSETAYR